MAATGVTQSPSSGLVGEAKAQAKILGGFVGLLWVIQIVNAILGERLVGLGIHPRTLQGLLGILFAPFIHVGFSHLIANTLPLVVLGWFVMLRKKRDLLSVSVISGIVGGLGAWLIAPAASVHVGASILIFGYLGYLLSRGIWERRFSAIVGSIAVFFLYGGALFGVLPGQVGISWQGHLFGLLGGILAARLLKQPRAATAETKSVARLERARPRVASSPARAEETPAEMDEDVEAELAKLKMR